MNQEFFKQELVKHHREGMAFLPLSEMLKEINFDQVGIRPEGLPYSFYELFYHVFYAQRDILDFIVEDTYKERNWPEDYWPEEQQPESPAAWEDLKKEYADDTSKLTEYLLDSTVDLSRPVKNATEDDQTLFREILLILRHTAYHTGQMLLILRLLGLHK